MGSKKGTKNPLNAKHYLSAHPLYKVWATVKNRCHNPNEPSYRHYGALGVKMCPEWLNDPKAFIEWALVNGWKKGLQIDKDIIPARKGLKPVLYSSETCMFVTRKVNCNHRTTSRVLEYNGVKKTLAQWSEELGINESTIHGRINTFGYSVEKALSEPVSFNKPLAEPKHQTLVTRDGLTKNISEWCKFYGISVHTFQSRVRSGRSFEDALTGENERKRLTLDAKVEVLRLHENGESQTAIARVLNLKRTSVGRIIHSKNNDV